MSPTTGLAAILATIENDVRAGHYDDGTTSVAGLTGCPARICEDFVDEHGER
jgi:hypothetical protein